MTRSALPSFLLPSLLLLAFTLTAAPIVAQEDPPKESKESTPHVNCPYCNHTGDKECKRIPSNALKVVEEGGALYCSELIACKDCGGTRRVDCTFCENHAVESRNKQHRDKLAEWVSARREKVDKLVGHYCRHAESKWFRLTFDLKDMMVGRVRYTPFMLTHLYIRRFEEHRARFQKILQVSDAELPDKCDIFMWRDGRDEALAALKFTGMGHSGSGVKLMGVNSVYTMHYERGRFPKDEDLHRHMVHNITHLLVSQMTPAEWIGKLKAGWVDAGLAHYFEYVLDGKCTTYCYQEVAKEMNFKGGKWLVPIRRLVASGDVPTFASLHEKNTDQLDPVEHALAFSYCHFLLEGDFVIDKVEQAGGKGRAMVQVIRILKDKRPTRDALRDVYDWNPLTFEEKWKEWVLRTYPKR